MTRRGWLLFAAMAVIWGIPYLLIKIAVGELTPVTLVFLRTALGAALLLPIAAARGGLRPLLPYWRWVLAYTVVEVSLPWFLLSDAERGLSSSLTGLLIAAVPLIGAVVTWLTRGADRRSRAGAGDRHHLLQPGGRPVAGRDGAARTLDYRGRHRPGADSPGIVLRDAEV